MPGQLLQDQPADGVLRLTISNPQKRNALDHAILDGIAEVLGTTDARCVILTGADGMFSSGYDIGDLPIATASGGASGATADVFAVEAEKLVAHPFTSALDALDGFDRPTVAACGGHTIGGGLELALACDFRIAAADIKLGMPPAKLGLVYSHTGLRRFIDAVGVPRTRELFLLGRHIDAEQAAEWGLVNRTVSSERVQEAALETATELAANAPLSVTGNKRVIRELLDAKWRLDADTEAELIALRKACFASEDFQEGVRAFAEKRQANWQGR